MEVTHMSEKVTHALIGGGVTQNFKMSSNAEFFEIMSSTLYKYQKLAVVREVACNSWDAHIISGKTITPIEIALDDEEMVFKDFGPGIAPDMIAEIYGTYGESTKKHDGQQTGGFGLGSKSPFAYVDHFEVTSCFEGIKTIYNISKSSAVVGGVPGITPIVAVPTDETGITVRIKLKKPADRAEFQTLIHGVVRNGEILAKFNGDLIDNLVPFSEAKHGFVIIKKQRLLDNSDSTILVRYGNVLYPVESHADYTNEFDYVCSFLNTIIGKDRYGYSYGNGSSKYAVIFQAPPHSLSITPSREALSMKEVTINTVKDVLITFKNKIEAKVVNRFNAIAVEETDAALARGEVGILLDGQRSLPGGVKHESRDLLMDIEDVARTYACKNYPSKGKYYFKDMQHRLHILATKYPQNRGLYQTFMQAMAQADKKKKSKDYWRENGSSGWLMRRVIAPLRMAMMKHGDPLLSFDRVFVQDTGSKGYRYSNSTGNGIIPKAKEYKAMDMYHYVPFLRNIMVVSYTRTDTKNRVGGFPEMAKLGSVDKYFVYWAQRGGTKAADAVAFFKARGFMVLDLTISHPWEDADVVAPKVVYDPKPRKKGVPILSSVLTTSTRTPINTLLAREDDVARILLPDFIMEITGGSRGYVSRLPRFKDESSKHIIELFGSVGGIAISSTQYKAWTARGIKPFDEYIVEKISQEMITNPRITEYLGGYNVIRDANLSDQESRIVKVICEVDALKTEFGVVNNMTDIDRKYLTIYREMVIDWTFKNDDAMVAADKHIKAIPPVKAFQDLVKYVDGNRIISLLDTHEIRSFFKSPPSDPVLVTKVKDTLIKALRG